jgi:SSS family solute:Na+ symporter
MCYLVALAGGCRHDKAGLRPPSSKKPTIMNLLTTADWLVIAAYFAATYIVALRHSATNRDNPTEFFLAGRNAGWFIVGASIFATNISSEHLVGLAGSGASGQFPAAQFELIAVFALLCLGWLFVPFYLRSGVFTTPEFLEARYSSGVRFYLAAISIVGYVLTKISVTIAAGGIVFEALMGLDFWTGAVIVVLATGVYTVIGGMRAVLVSDMFQMFVMVGGAVVVTVVGLEAVGGWGELRAAAPPHFLSLWRATSDPDFPWTGILFGAPILAVWYWCTDQYIVQRTLAAKSIGEARRAAFFAASLKLTPLFIFVLPGVIAYVLAQRGQLTLANADSALPTLIGSLLPAGLRGLVVAGLLAALMSSLSSVFNSCAALVTMDVYKRLAPHHSERRLVLVGQATTGLMVLFGLAWIPLMDLISGQLYVYLQSVQAYISPPIAAVFLIGVLWPRANARGALAALLTGLVLGFTRLALELNRGSLSGAAEWLASINFLHFAILLFALCSAVLVIVSLLTRPPDAARVEPLTIRYYRESAGAQPSRAADILLSAALAGLVAAAWLFFS